MEKTLTQFVNFSQENFNTPSALKETLTQIINFGISIDNQEISMKNDNSSIKILETKIGKLSRRVVSRTNEGLTVKKIFIIYLGVVLMKTKVYQIRKM